MDIRKRFNQLIESLIRTGAAQNFHFAKNVIKSEFPEVWEEYTKKRGGDGIMFDEKRYAEVIKEHARKRCVAGTTLAAKAELMVSEGRAQSFKNAMEILKQTESALFKQYIGDQQAENEDLGRFYSND